MAKITEIVSSQTVKVNVGDYQSVDFFTSMKSEGQFDERGAILEQDRLNRLVNSASLAKLRSHFKARGKKYSDEQICRIYGIMQPKQPEFG